MGNKQFWPCSFPLQGLRSRPSLHLRRLPQGTVALLKLLEKAVGGWDDSLFQAHQEALTSCLGSVETLQGAQTSDPTRKSQEEEVFLFGTAGQCGESAAKSAGLHGQGDPPLPGTARSHPHLASSFHLAVSSSPSSFLAQNQRKSAIERINDIQSCKTYNMKM